MSINSDSAWEMSHTNCFLDYIDTHPNLPNSNSLGNKIFSEIAVELNSKFGSARGFTIDEVGEHCKWLYQKHAKCVGPKRKQFFEFGRRYLNPPYGAGDLPDPYLLGLETRSTETIRDSATPPLQELAYPRSELFQIGESEIDAFWTSLRTKSMNAALHITSRVDFLNLPVEVSPSERDNDLQQLLCLVGVKSQIIPAYPDYYVQGIIVACVVKWVIENREFPDFGCNEIWPILEDILVKRGAQTAIRYFAWLRKDIEHAVSRGPRIQNELSTHRAGVLAHRLCTAFVPFFAQNEHALDETGSPGLQAIVEDIFLEALHFVVKLRQLDGITAISWPVAGEKYQSRSMTAYNQGTSFEGKHVLCILMPEVTCYQEHVGEKSIFFHTKALVHLDMQGQNKGQADTQTADDEQVTLLSSGQLPQYFGKAAQEFLEGHSIDGVKTILPRLPLKKPWRCPDCVKTYTCKSSLEYHLKKARTPCATSKPKISSSLSSRRRCSSEAPSSRSAKKYRESPPQEVDSSAKNPSSATTSQETPTPGRRKMQDPRYQLLNSRQYYKGSGDLVAENEKLERLRVPGQYLGGETEKPWKCNTCDKRYENMRKLKYHTMESLRPCRPRTS